MLHTDDTTVQRQDPETGQWSTARFWNSVGDEAYSPTVFQYTLAHERTHPATFLRDYAVDNSRGKVQNVATDCTGQYLSARRTS